MVEFSYLYYSCLCFLIFGSAVALQTEVPPTPLWVMVSVLFSKPFKIVPSVIYKCAFIEQLKLTQDFLPERTTEIGNIV